MAKSKLDKAYEAQQKKHGGNATEQFVEAGKATRFGSDNQPKNRGRKKKVHSITPKDMRKALGELLAKKYVYLEQVLEDAEAGTEEIRLEKRKLDLTVLETVLNNTVRIAMGGGSKDNDALNATKLLFEILGSGQGQSKPKEQRQPLVVIQNGQQLNAFSSEMAASRGVNVTMPVETPVEAVETPVETPRIETPKLKSAKK